MDTKIQNILIFSIIATLLLSVVAGFWYVKIFSDSRLPQRVFQVQGEGKVVAVPDVAQLSFGVTTEGGKNIADLQKKNSEKSNAIISFLKEQGIDEKDIKTEYYNISPRSQYYSCPPIPILQGESSVGFVESGEAFPIRSCPPSEIIGYTIQQSLSVKVRDLNKVGDVLAGVVERGANNVYGPSFTVDTLDVLQNQAREKAVAQAREKAQALAKAGGFRLGKIVSIQEGFSMPYPMPFSAQYEKGIGGGIAPDIEPGSQEITSQVTLIYEIK